MPAQHGFEGKNLEVSMNPGQAQHPSPSRTASQAQKKEVRPGPARPGKSEKPGPSPCRTLA